MEDNDLAAMQARLDANELIIDVLATVSLSGTDDALRRLFTGALVNWTRDPAPKLNLNEDDALARADRIIMMQSALKLRVEQLAAMLGTTALLDPPVAPPVSSE